MAQRSEACKSNYYMDIYVKASSLKIKAFNLLCVCVCVCKTFRSPEYSFTKKGLNREIKLLWQHEVKCNLFSFFKTNFFYKFKLIQEFVTSNLSRVSFYLQFGFIFSNY